MIADKISGNNLKRKYSLFIKQLNPSLFAWIGLSYISIFSVIAQTSEKLPATTIIGTEISVDYDNDSSPSTTVNTIHNVFDGNLRTYFASYERSGTWVGLDLGEPHVITTIAYAPRRDYIGGPERLLLGIFEGANEPDFLDAVPLLMITEAPPTDTLTAQDVTCSKGFRYVRYVGPSESRCNIAEIEFYGYKGSGENSQYLQLTNLPTINIHTEEAEDITSKDYYINGTVTIITDDGKSLFHDGLGIRGRGHFSWTGLPKKPYRIKLFNKVNLLGFPAKARSWTLIPNYGDKTLMRNLLAFDLSRRLEMAYTSVAMPVDVILNGEYKGTYNLCDQVDVAPDRIEVEEMTSEDITAPNVTGGYFIEVDTYAYEEISWFASALKRTPVRTRYPDDEDIVKEQYEYIRAHYNKMESAIFAPDYKDSINGYRRYLDVESFIRHFLVGEITGNTDTYWSVYMYKERDDDIFRFGPVWDLDLAYENDYRTYPINDHVQWVYQYGSAAPGFRDVVNRLLTDDYFVERVKSIYACYRENGALDKDALLKVADYYTSLLYRSQQINFMRWNIMNRIVHGNPSVFGSYEGEVANVKRYISERIDWMDYKLNYNLTGNASVQDAFSNIAVYSRQNAICINHISETVNITVIDITGRLIISKTIQDNTFIPVSKGMYVITITDGKGNQRNAKCVVL